MNRLVFVLLTVLFSQISFGQTEIKTMFYNLLNFSSAPPTNRLEILNSILSTYEPDLFMVCEVESQQDAQNILNHSFQYTSANIAQSPFLFNTSGASLIHQLVYYDADKFTLNYTDQIETNVRSINHYSFELKTNSDITLEVFVAHLKASRGYETERTNEAKQFVNYIERFSADSNILLAGDFNMYSASEQGYQTLLNGTSAFHMNDPINESGEWSSNSSFAGVHTQSTRLSSSDFDYFGAGGGLDDRFDFMLISDHMISETSAISYMEDTYKAWGNNSNCYNNNINSINCDGEFDQELRESLYLMSDHLPVVMNLKISEDFLSTPGYEKENLIVFESGNIVSSQLDLKFSNQLLFKKAKVYNTLGQEVLGFDVFKEKFSVDTSSLSSGLYFIKIDNFPVIKKFYITP